MNSNYYYDPDDELPLGYLMLCFVPLLFWAVGCCDNNYADTTRASSPASIFSTPESVHSEEGIQDDVIQLLTSDHEPDDDELQHPVPVTALRRSFTPISF